MKRLAWLAGVVMLAGCDLDVVGLNDCDDRIDFTDEISAAGLIALLVDAERGDLRVEGRSGINSVRVRARACADDRRTRDDIDFELFSSGENARLISYVPDRADARLDLVVEVPLDFDVDVYHRSGDIEIEDVYAVWITDGSGHIEVNDIETDVIIEEDGSGDIDVWNVGGDFIVEYDSSGDIDYSNIRGRVLLP